MRSPNTIGTLERLLDGVSPYQYGRMLYKVTECGPWIGYVMRDSKTVHYSDAANINIKDCVGIEVGSIVEGSEAEVGPYYLEFPFTGKQLDMLVGIVNKTACRLWKVANK